MLIHARSHTPSKVRRRSYVGAATVAFALIGALATSANAEAATPGSPNASQSGSETGTAAVSAASCTSHWSYYKTTGLEFGGYGKVEWTSNSCGYLIQTRVWCSNDEASPPVGAWSTSGKVKKVDLWDQAGCSALDLRGGTYVRFSYNGGSTWTAYQSY
jgi:hypothetical protein